LIISRNAEDAPCLISHDGLNSSPQSSTPKLSNGQSSSLKSKLIIKRETYLEAQHTTL